MGSVPEPDVTVKPALGLEGLPKAGRVLAN